ncbi:hypothetical protein EMCG_06108 [[Emmonsia] crescens]|uniref:Uncharacterized protein n=1 Tax=[Emmonsia] crescens TaxID=73230 RepID=A0A0G2IC29_9EURO|nr:hypothetical protein EMCG_06108 [Emmonsia crescens UAMH 3008]
MDKIVPDWDPLYPKYNIDSLNPSNISKLYGKTERDFDLKELKILFNHYGWGFRHEHTRLLKADRFRILVKIIHYTNPILRPTHEDFAKCASDAGPGLLIPECGALPFTIRHPPPSRRDQPMDEYFRKAMLQFPYRSLERSPSDFPILPTAAENSPIQRTEQGIIEDRYRGRGPTGDGGFDGVLYYALDCALVAARLLDAGCTKADRANPYWHRMLSDLEKTFLELVWRNWGDDLDKHYPTPKQLRDSLSEYAATLKHKIIEDLKTGQTVVNKWPIKSVWESCTKSFCQFLVRYDQHSKHHYPCGSSNEPRSSSARCIPLKANRRDPSKNTIEAQMAGFFTDNYWTKCDGCERLAKEPGKGDRTNPTKGHIETQRRFHELPLRLAFMTDPNAWPGSHTASNIVINYRDWNGKCERATYRWLGGIYPIEQHNCCRYVVFWNDHERYETDSGKLRKYDAQEGNGRIIRGFASMGNGSERVPLSDLQRGQPALLFYEQVVNPPQNYTQEVQDAITRSMESVHQSESVTIPAGNQTSSRTSPTNVGVGIPSEGPQQGIAIPEDYDYPEGVASYQPTNPQFKRGPQQPSYQLSPRPPSSSRAQPPRTTKPFHYESRSPQSQRDAEPLYQSFFPGQNSSSYTSAQYPGGPAQINPLSSHSHYYLYPAGQYDAPEQDISAQLGTVATTEHLPLNMFDLINETDSLQNPFQAHADVQSIDPQSLTTVPITHPSSRNISPVNAAPQPSQSYQNRSLPQSPTTSSLNKYFTDYLGPVIGESKPTPEDVDDQRSHHTPSTQATDVNYPVGYAKRVYSALFLESPPSQQTSHLGREESFSLDDIDTGFGFFGFPEIPQQEAGPSGESRKRARRPEDEFGEPEGSRKRQRK